MAEAIGAVESAGQTAAGIYSTGESALALFNSRGVAARYAETMARFSITAMADGSSGWAKASACHHAGLNPLQLARTAARKAAESRDPRELAPGRYQATFEVRADVEKTDGSGLAMAVDVFSLPGGVIAESEITRDQFGDGQFHAVVVSFTLKQSSVMQFRVRAYAQGTVAVGAISVRGADLPQ